MSAPDLQPNIDVRAADRASADFLDLPYRLYADDPAWRAPLRMERKAQLDPKRNPAMAQIEPRFFTAWRDGRCVGRIAAFLNREHDARYGGADAFFGYFEAEDDPIVGDILLSHAKDWARGRGRTRLLGPAMWSVNEEIGLLVDGFEYPNAVLMPHGKPHQLDTLIRNGFSKTVDVLAYTADLSDGAPKKAVVMRMGRMADNDPLITYRSMDTKHFEADVALAMTIFNDGWSENWGFLPFSETQIAHMAKEMKPIMFPEGFWVGFIDGEPAAFIWMIPDVNALAEGFDGRLLPFNWARLLWRLKMRKVKRARIPLMGLKTRYHGTRKGVALVTRLCQQAFDSGKAQGFDRCELSWILEDNESMKMICELADAKPYKRYRMLETAL